ncbi:MAG: chromosomal replication initiator protein DnaA, partial [Dehalococcoidia bacterium]|nr:chromosomal replication initiator protein DnaA [Dehalococcoidia bacterium]
RFGGELEAAKEIWQKVLGELQIQVSRANYATWLKNSYGISCQEDSFLVGVPNAFVAEWLTKRLYALVRKTLAQVIGRDVDIRFTVHSQGCIQCHPILAGSQTDGGTTTRAKTGRFNAKHTFDSFVVGESNRLAHAAALEVAENPGLAYNPLFIYGDTGYGKTHLLHAIGHKAVGNGLEVIYTTAEQFTSEFVVAVKKRLVEEFRDRFKSIEILLFDDIQFIANKKQTQQSFFHIFNELHNSSKQVVITADRPPQDMDLLSNKLKSRLQCGLTTGLQAPDYESRLSILRAKAEEAMAPISEEVLELLAERVRGSARQLEGALIYLGAQAKLTGRELTRQTVNILLTSITGKQDTKLTVQATAEYFALSVEELTGNSRNRKTSLARQIAMYLMRQESNYSFAEIGRELGHRNHATIIHGYQKIAAEIMVNSKLRGQIMDIREMCTRNKLSPEGC